MRPRADLSHAGDRVTRHVPDSLRGWVRCRAAEPRQRRTWPTAGVIDGTTLYQTAQPAPLTPGADFALDRSQDGNDHPRPKRIGFTASISEQRAWGIADCHRDRDQRADRSGRRDRRGRPKHREADSKSDSHSNARRQLRLQRQQHRRPLPQRSPRRHRRVPLRVKVPVPAIITVSGQASYTDPCEAHRGRRSDDHVVQVDPNGPTTVVVGEKRIDEPRAGADQLRACASIRRSSSRQVDTFLFATLLDGKEAWTNAERNQSRNEWRADRRRLRCR